MLQSALVVEGSSLLQILQQPFHKALINVRVGVCGAAGCFWSAGMPCTVLLWEEKKKKEEKAKAAFVCYEPWSSASAHSMLVEKNCVCRNVVLLGNKPLRLGGRRGWEEHRDISFSWNSVGLRSGWRSHSLWGACAAIRRIWADLGLIPALLHLLPCQQTLLLLFTQCRFQQK